MTRSLPTRLALAMTLSALVTTSFAAAPAAAGRPTDRPWSGFRIAQNDTAATPWVGARKVNKRVVYRIDPRAARDAGPRFGPVKKVSKVSGKGRKAAASRLETRRAAYILAKYGPVKDDIQAAAVDAAVLHLLEGGKFRLNRDAGRARILRTGRAKAVKGLARALLRESARHSGPYVVTSVQRGSAIPGGDAEIVVSVASRRTGAPMVALPVTVTSQGSTRSSVTDEAGRAYVRLPAPEAGTHQVDIRVDRVPSTRLLVRKPAKKAGSRVAIAGAKRSLQRVGTLVVTEGSPKVRVEVTKNRLNVGNEPRGTFTVTGSVGAQSRPVTIERFGPFAKGSQARCRDNGSVYYKSATITITGNGTYSLPQWKLKAEGYYLYSVTVGANDANPRAFTCGAKVHAV